MNNFSSIQTKLEQFIRRYYTNDLLKGSILFFAIGFIYLLITLFIEYILWLNPTARAILFWVFVAVELGLFVRFILWPLLKLFKFQDGIDFEEASKIIGKHFPEVNDKLLNVLQLQKTSQQSELLMASIEQKSTELHPVPFKLAVNFRKSLVYLKYAAIPVLILLLTFFTGHFNWFSDSYQRVVNYKTAYEPPAPFQFFVVNEQLQTIENKEFKLVVKTAGKVVPENAQIHYLGETYFLRPTAPGAFEYIFPQLKNDVSFTLSANGVISKPYELNIVNVPTLVNFEMVLDYPSYTNRVDEVLKSTGNTTVPEGTAITWKIKTRSTEQVVMYANDTLDFDIKSEGSFEISKRLYSNLEYNIATSNKSLKNYENLAYSIQVTKDAYPELNMKVELDSIDQQSLYFYGQASDDYGLSKLQLVYYPAENEVDKKMEDIPVVQSNFAEFVSAFPNNLFLEEGVTYEIYFQVFDNDAIHKFKSVKSNVYTYRKLTKDEEEVKQLKEQNETIKNLDNSFEKMKLQEKQLEELSKTQKEKEQLNFNDKKKLESFIQRQKQQEEMMKNFNKRLKENLEDFQKENTENDPFKEDLKERLKDNEEQLQKDEKLLKELEALQDKIQKEELTEKLDDLAKQNKNKQKSLQQLLELTKRYYVAKKAEKLQEDLEKLAEDQDELSKENKEENTKEKQDDLNEDFEDFQMELDKLQQENKALKKPLNVPQDLETEKEIQKDQQEASEDLEKKEDAEEKNDQNTVDQKQKSAQQKQKDAAKKMKQMSAKMSQSMMSGGQEQMQEDAEMLRQILDNLVLFSFDQEGLMNQFKSIQINHNQYGKFLRKQSSLREHFEHIDDSLFALSLRQPKLSEDVNKKITDVFYNIDKSMGQLSENLLYQGVATQQYTITATNDLASYLSDILDNMESAMNPGQGKGKGQGGEGMQLPDIIMSQKELNKQMEEGLKKSSSGKPKNGEGNENGDGEKGEKENGKSGKEGKEGNGGTSDGEGEGSSETMNGELYRIYQQQQQLRQALENKLQEMGKSVQGQNLLKQMEAIESDLINKGFTNQTLQRMMSLQHQLLKLENATFMQGEENRRESNTNLKQFENTSNNQIPTAKEYFNTTEILNRQALPLQQIYKKKVQEYFKKEND
ncbi:hypothetical protein LX77_01895 [Gelidibacter algens]|uniref:DUF4175 family protein n=1 Tax=Gelidibacter algens TaxID=49280 RepID=A0A1A7QXN3_9FLAO|nr:DUF4175 family protein [Gelidibacter algens]OBX23979.1 hypothetical protein A9996_15500 [Gelidibacter algens]RAJ24343.1 hypothetical protein LX77_01895 [Gelidibacter algens]